MKLSPYIEKAAFNIAYDNGLINRHCTQEKWLEIVAKNINSTFTQLEILYVEQKLSVLSDTDLEILCSGEYSEALEILNDDLVDRFLDFIFENN